MEPRPRSLFISDIHGHFSAFTGLLEAVRYLPGRDRLVLLGDYVGRGPDNLRCLQLVGKLVKRVNVFGLMGNHEHQLLKVLRSQDVASGQRYAYTQTLAEQIQDPDAAMDLLDGLGPWYADDFVIAVHAGVNPELDDWRNSSLEEFTTIREPFLTAPLSVPQTVIFGHTPCVSIHGSPSVWFGPGKIGIDGGAGHGGQLNCLIFDGTRFSSASMPCR